MDRYSTGAADNYNRGMDKFGAFLGRSAWIGRFVSLIPAGDVLLLADEGGHALDLAAAGYRVEAALPDAAAASSLAGVPGVEVRLVDPDKGLWPYFGRAFDGVIVAGGLRRSLIPALLGSLAERGVLIWESPMLGDERFSPKDPDLLPRPGELLELVRNRLVVVAFEQGEVEQPRRGVIQRLCARRGREFRLPESSPPAG